MPGIRVKEGESTEIACRRFKRAVEKAGILTDARRREAYESPSELRKRKKAAAIKRYLKRLQREAPVPREAMKRRRKKKPMGGYDGRESRTAY